LQRKTNKKLYLIPVLSKALDVLELLRQAGQPMTLEAIHRSTRTSKTTVYRILKTFVHRGYLSQAADGTYRHVSGRNKLRFGFGSQSAELPFSVEVSESLQAAAVAAGVDLMVLDNRYDAATAVRNAEEFVASKVDLVIEFQVEQEVAPVIADRIAAANIPLIAIDIPHPHATFFGVDNYRVGMEAGEQLAVHAAHSWGGKVGWVLGLDLVEAGPLVQSRITGAFEAVRKAYQEIPAGKFVRMDGRGLRETSKKLVHKFLESHPKEKHILIAAATDSSALGAVDAIREHKRERWVAVMGQDCIAEAMEEMRRASSPLIGTGPHETSTYGPNLINLALSLLRGQMVPPYNYVAHRMVTRSSILAQPAGDDLLR
jgi:ribose transport system substrate-binding protein